MLRCAMRLVFALLALTACSDRLTSSRAAELLRRDLPPEPITVGAGDWDRLVQQGFLRHDRRASFENSYVVTPEGVAHGLQKVVERGPGSITISFEIHVCDRVPGQVTSMTPLERGTARGAEVAYVRRATAPPASNPLLSDTDLRAACDSTGRWPARAVFVRDSAGWRLNRPPAFDEPPSIKTQYEYDPRGLLWGARSTASFAGPPRDPDGDTVTVHWYAPGDTVPQVITARPEGFQVSVEHLIIMGRPESAHGRLIITDAWGVADTMSVGVTIR